MAVQTDSRQINSGDQFIALSGKNHNGNEFALQAAHKGASQLILDSKPSNYSELQEYCTKHNISIIFVDSGLTKYQELASQHLQQYNLTVIAITGSNGKTTAKELLQSILSREYTINNAIVYTHLNENNEIGVPKTIFKITDQTKYLIIELGMRQLGEIKTLTQIVQPDFAVITNIGSSHIGRLGSQKNIAQAKAEIFTSNTKPCHVICSHNDRNILQEYINKHTHNQYSIINNASQGSKQTEDLIINLAQILNIPDTTIQNGLEIYKNNTLTGRGNKYTLINNYTLIDESYNASPESIQDLAKRLNPDDILILGQIAELGEYYDILMEPVLQYIKNKSIILKQINNENFDEILNFLNTEINQSVQLNLQNQHKQIAIKASNIANFGKLRELILQKFKYI